MRQVTHALLTRPPLSQLNLPPEGFCLSCFVRLACVKSFPADLSAQFFPESLFDRSIEIQRLRNTHAVNFASDDPEACAAEHINDSAGAHTGTIPVIRLDDRKGPFRTGNGFNCSADNVIFSFEEFRKDRQAFSCTFLIGGRKNCRFKILQRTEVSLLMMNGSADGRCGLKGLSRRRRVW